MKFRYKILLLSFCAILLTSFLIEDDIFIKISRSIDIFGRVYKEVTTNYVDEINPEEFMLAGVKGMLSSLDPYTVYINEFNQKDIDAISKGKYGGIGASIGVSSSEIIIVNLVEGFSAQRQGVRLGDILKKINDHKITSENYDSLDVFMYGEPGSELKLTIERPGVPQPIDFALVRELIEIKNISYYGFLPESSNNAYIKLSSFSKGTGDELKNVLVELKNKKEVKSIILDLRGNPGGLLDASVDVCEKFLEVKDKIVSVESRDPRVAENYVSVQTPIAGETPLIVLIDGGSASASEIVAGAIQDNDRGVILGTNSFGKGLVQTVIPMSMKTSLKITTGKYFTPSGRCIQKVDYSEKSRVISDKDKIKLSEYYTKNGRPVYSQGGIKPDTTVETGTKSFQVMELIKKGMFFKFATQFFNKESGLKLEQIQDSKIFDEFSKYISNSEFEYISGSEKLVEQLKKTIKTEGYNSDLNTKLDEIKSVLENQKKLELEKYKKDIIAEIREELAARIYGQKGRIVESLKYDKQFEASLKLFKNIESYKKLLRYAE